MRNEYIELQLLTDEAYLDLIADFVMQHYDEGIEYGKDRLILRSEDEAAIARLEAALEILKESLEAHVPLRWEKTRKPNEDWIKRYQASVTPIHSGDFYIRPSWYAPKEGLIDIVIDPALAFGSGHHATTYSCLEAVSACVSKGDEVLDVGCGSGILALAARKRGATVDLCDTDPLAVESAKENFERNGETYRRIWEGSADKTDTVYDVVVANIIADILKMIAPTLKARTREGGRLILSGILDKKEAGVQEAFSNLVLETRIPKEEWITLIYRKDIHG